MKKLKNLKGIEVLSKNEQKSVNGGITVECNNAINEGYAIHKGGKSCPADYPISSGGCCYPA